MRTIVLRSKIGAVACAVSLVSLLVVTGCGGEDGAPTLQATPKEQAALERAHALNRDAIGQIKAERANAAARKGQQ